MVSGHEIRLNRILRKGKMLCIPMDHGISNGPIEGLENPHDVIKKCEHHGLTSVIINKGTIKTLPNTIKIGILVHFSGFSFCKSVLFGSKLHGMNAMKPCVFS